MANISEEIRETKLRWSGHLERKTEEDTCSNENMEVGGDRNILGTEK